MKLSCPTAKCSVQMLSKPPIQLKCWFSAGTEVNHISSVRLSVSQMLHGAGIFTYGDFWILINIPMECMGLLQCILILSSAR